MAFRPWEQPPGGWLPWQQQQPTEGFPPAPTWAPQPQWDPHAQAFYAMQAAAMPQVPYPYYDMNAIPVMDPSAYAPVVDPNNAFANDGNFLELAQEEAEKKAKEERERSQQGTADRVKEQLKEQRRKMKESQQNSSTTPKTASQKPKLSTAQLFQLDDDEEAKPSTGNVVWNSKYRAGQNPVMKKQMILQPSAAMLAAALEPPPPPQEPPPSHLSAPAVHGFVRPVAEPAVVGNVGIVHAQSDEDNSDGQPLDQSGPDNEMLEAMQKLAQLVQKHGQSFEDLVKNKNLGVAKYRFLSDTSSLEYGYYRSLVTPDEFPPPPPPDNDDAPPPPHSSSDLYPPPPPSDEPPPPPPTSESLTSPVSSSQPMTDSSTSSGRKKKRNWDVAPPADSVVNTSSTLSQISVAAQFPLSTSLPTMPSEEMPKRKRNRFSEGPPVPFDDTTNGSVLAPPVPTDAPPPVPLTPAEAAVARMNAVFDNFRKADKMRGESEEMDELTKKKKAGHHIGDYLPDSELNKFMMKAKGVKVPIETGDRIASSNKGFQLLNKMGWQEGAGLGKKGTGIAVPIQAGGQTTGLGVGAEAHGTVRETDDPFTQYKKRMALSYKFRPNPLNNPRAAYWDNEVMNTGATPQLELNPLSLTPSLTPALTPLKPA